MASKALATDATTVDTNRKQPSELLVYDLEKKKYTVEKPLRGYNFFTPLVQGEEVFLGMSTGDILKINYKSGKLTYLDLFPEPFMSTGFQWQDDLCLMSTMGRLACYNGKNKRVTEKRKAVRTIVGETRSLAGKVYLPTRIGYFILEKI